MQEAQRRQRAGAEARKAKEEADRQAKEEADSNAGRQAHDDAADAEPTRVRRKRRRRTTAADVDAALDEVRAKAQILADVGLELAGAIGHRQKAFATEKAQEVVEMIDCSQNVYLDVHPEAASSHQ